MDHSEFIIMVEGSSLVPMRLWFFRDDVILRWLAENSWVRIISCPCPAGGRLDLTAEKCAEIQREKNSCYRLVLKRRLIPFLLKAKAGRYPTLAKLTEIVYQGSAQSPPCHLSLLNIIIFELSKTARSMRE